MSIERITKALEDHAALLDSLREPYQGKIGRSGTAAAIREVIALLRTHQDAQPNEPLTLEDLREMDGRPVWVERPGYGAHWAMVQVWAKSTNIIYLIYNNGAVLHPQVEIACGAKFYRRPQKECI